LKPANIMIGKDDEALIMDFGIARSTEATGGGSGVNAPLPSLARRALVKAEGTMVGTIVGTVEYMAPEQAKGQTVDQRADLYAMGLILYDMLTGKRRSEHAPSAIAEPQ